MKATWKSLIAVAALLLGLASTASAQTAAAAAVRQPVLLGTTGACHNQFPGGPCTQTSTLVQVNPATGALIREIGPVGYTVNGLVWDARSGKLYASTAIGDVTFHGLITIDPFTGQGTPVNPAATNFGLAGDPSPIHSITIDFLGNMVAWYDEPPGPGVSDTFVRLNKRTGIATEFPSTGIDTNQNGLAFQTFGFISILWNIDSPKADPVTGVVAQKAYVLNPLNGKPLITRPINPPMNAALGDFNPRTLQYYGLDFPPGRNTPDVNLVVVDPVLGTARMIGPTVPELHVLAFVK
jgi:hypothetical protein